MAGKHDVTLAPARTTTDPFALLRKMTTELDRVFDEPLWSSRFPWFRATEGADATAWAPRVDVFERDNRFVTRVDLPGMKKEDVTVEVLDGRLALSGERKREKEEKKDNVYRTEREYGRFYRAVPLPEGVKLEDVRATFADGVLEVTVPLAVRPQPTAQKVEIHEPDVSSKKTAA